MERIKLTEENFSDAVKKASTALKQGYAIVFPTDTLYGLGVDALREDAVERLFYLKKRPANKPVPIFVKDIEMAKELAFIDARQEEILKKLWPGPFTAVLFKKNKISLRLTANTQKVGLRIPNSDFCRALIREFGGPFTGSSANVSGMESMGDIDEIFKQFKEHSTAPDLVIDAGDILSSEPSTILDITQKEPLILRVNQTTLRKMSEIFDKKLGS
ncbi:MAG: L-threonylcarbamoyladenylate synthase [Candidatus Spechtbacteria bacterium]|nr:L-threonylcarbamoyladenylate synthase [Candidatus Spechtbacteria bacterium]